MSFIKIFQIKKYSRIFINPLIIIITIFLISTLTTINLPIQATSGHNQQTNSQRYALANNLLSSSNYERASITSINRFSSSTSLNTTNLIFNNITVHSSTKQFVFDELTVDNRSNIYGLGSLTQSSNYYLSQGIFLVKISPDGHQLWNKTWGTSGDIGTKIVLDPQGDIYTLDQSTGIYNSSLQFNIANLTLIKWTQTGNVVWNKTFLLYTTNSLPVSTIAIDHSNNVYLAYPAYPVKNSYSYYVNINTTVLKFDSAGIFLWNQTVNTPINAITAGPLNNLYLTGNSGTFKLSGVNGSLFWYNNNINGSGIQVDTADHIYTFFSAAYSANNIQKWSSNQTELWSLNPVSINISSLSSINIILGTNDTNLYLTGETSNAVILARISSAGEILWYRNISYNAGNVAFSNSYLTIAVTGYVYTLTLSYPQPTGYVITLWDSNGNKRQEISWIIHPVVSLVKSIIDSQGDIYALGSSNFNINTENFYVSYTQQVLFKYSSINGTLLWNTTWTSHIPYSSNSIISTGNSYINTYGVDIGIDANGNVYTLGNAGYTFLVVRWSPVGLPVWNYSFNNFYNPKYSSLTTSGINMHFGPAGNIYVLATYQNSSLYSTNNVMLLKLSPNGQPLWSKTWSNLGNIGTNFYSYSPISFLALLSNTHHDMYMTYLSLHQNTKISPSTSTFFVSLLHLDSSGNILTNTSIFRLPTTNTGFFNTPILSTSAPHDFAIDTAGSLYIGYSEVLYQLNSNGVTIQSRPYLLKYDSNGNLLLNKTLSYPTNYTTIASLSMDNAGYIYVLTDSIPITNNQIPLTILHVMSANGNEIWNQSFEYIIGNQIYIDPHGNMLITGVIANTYNLNLPTTFSQQIFLISNHPLVNENTGDLLTTIVTFITNNLALLVILMVGGIIGVSIGLTYLSRNSINFSFKGHNFSDKKIHNMSSQPNFQRTHDTFGKNPPLQDLDPDAVNLIEQILIETYQAPDYAAALQIQQGGFPDYTTYKQALEKGISTYKDWKEKYP